MHVNYFQNANAVEAAAALESVYGTEYEVGQAAVVLCKYSIFLMQIVKPIKYHIFKKSRNINDNYNQII
jgi:hypothetical protein